ncbi:MAG: ABC transporter ATP-binding protein [Desulfobacteraceae bacterium]|nr:ABC transporter ATP-binding protein [Desulfobacteraceae bacterium]
MRSDFGYFEEEELGKPYDIKLMKRLYPFAKPYSRWFFITILLIIVITVLDLSVPYITAIAIDRYIVPKFDISGSGHEIQKSEIRYLRVDISDPEINSVVARYSNMFATEGHYAFIPFDDLAELKKNDLYILRKNDLAGVSLIAGFFLFIIILNFTLNFIRVMVMEYSCQNIMHDIRVKLFAHMQGLSVSFFNRNPMGRLVTRVTNDAQNMHDLFSSIIVFLFKDVFLLAGITIVLLAVNWKLALASFTVLPFVIYTSVYFSNQARDVYRVLRIKLAEISTMFSETIGGINVIQIFNQELNNFRKFEHLNNENYMAGMKQIQIFAVFMPVIEILGSVAVAIVIFYGGGSVISNNITLGALVAFISYMRMFFRPIRDIAEKYNIMQSAMASAERLFLILDTDEKLRVVSSQQSAVSSQEPIRELVMDNVSLSYIGDEKVLKGISLKVRAGQTIAIVGPTGSGKTSLINLIIRFYDPVSGRVLINGRDIREISTSALRSKMALVTQDPFLFSTTIRENIFQQNSDKLQDSDWEKYANRILEASNCKSLVEKLPDGLDTQLSEGGTSISSGERQLISIARAFASDPELIIFDEATSYIDSETEEKIQKALVNLMHDRTGVIVAHRLSTIRNADIIIVLNRGRIIESGTHDELLKIKGFYFRLNQL